MNIEQFYKALSDSTRLRIISLIIYAKEICVCQITACLELTQSNVSNHLEKLRLAAIISSRKKSKFIYYKIDEIFKKEHKALYESLKYSTQFVAKKDKDIKRFNACPKIENLTCCDAKEVMKEINKYIKRNGS